MSKRDKLLYAYIMRDIYGVGFGLAIFLFLCFWYAFRDAYFFAMVIVGIIFFFIFKVDAKRYINNLRKEDDENA